MVDEELISWGRTLEQSHEWVLHLPSLACGPVETFFTGEEGNIYISAIDGKEVRAPVLLLSTGHALLAAKEAFQQIGHEEATVYIDTIDRMRNAIIEATNGALKILRGRSADPELPMILIIAALRSQLYTLEATTSTTPPPALVANEKAAASE